MAPISSETPIAFKDETDQLFFKLLNLVGDVKWQDWVFAFGTVNYHTVEWYS